VTMIKTYEVTFEDLTHDARGVCKIDGFPVFVLDALKGEKGIIEITKRYKSYGIGRLIRLTHKSPYRVVPICEHYASCGACNMMHMDYKTQLDFKSYKTKETIKKLGKLDVNVEETIGMDHPLYYRNKAIFHFQEQGKLTAGYYQKGTHNVIDIERCHLLPKVFTEILQTTKKFILEHQIPIYSKDRQTGVFKALMIRQSVNQKTLIVTLMLSKRSFQYLHELTELLIVKFPLIEGVIVNVSKEFDHRLSDNSTCVHGHDSIKESIEDIHYFINHKSFFQVNPIQASMMIKTIKAKVNFKPSDIVVDAYAGVGHLGLSVAKKVKKVIGLEKEIKAVSEGKKTARYNHIENMTFVTGDVLETLDEVSETIDVLLVDPPRKGLHPSFIQKVLDKKIPKIVYVSCNPATLARDLNLFCKEDYDCESVTPIDMFPQTSHVENVTLLSLKTP